MKTNDIKTAVSDKFTLTVLFLRYHALNRRARRKITAEMLYWGLGFAAIAVMTVAYSIIGAVIASFFVYTAIQWAIMIFTWAIIFAKSYKMGFKLGLWHDIGVAWADDERYNAKDAKASSKRFEIRQRMGQIRTRREQRKAARTEKVVAGAHGHLATT